MNAPKLLDIKEDSLDTLDFYEISMAYANYKMNYFGLESVFNLVVRELPANKVIGNFVYEGVKYDKLAKRDYMINAGLEQAMAVLLYCNGTKDFSNYLKEKQGITDEAFLKWVENASFKGDMYAMKEGEVFFAKEPQLRLHEAFEINQLYETLMLTCINPETNVASIANDISLVSNNKILLEGSSRRADSPNSAVLNTRAARIGGFNYSSLCRYGRLNNEVVGGTHGHSYVLLHPSEYLAFKAQSKVFKNNVCFLLDTYNLKKALNSVVKIAKEDKLEKFAVRIDSGDLLKQSRYIHEFMKMNNINNYGIVASDDLNASKIDYLEKNNAGIEKYLVGTALVCPPKPNPGVFKMCAYKKDNTWIPTLKVSEDKIKSTLPGIQQVYRIIDDEGFYAKDIIGLFDEDLSNELGRGQAAKELLIPVIKSGKQVYSCQSIKEISNYRNEELKKFKDLTNYPVIISKGIEKLLSELL
ncbi:MAG: hypothetical protein WC376_00425 [Candidatus Nanoarchaeia archaeon]|jgi:nicotinate phosphoribosyltransferase